MQNSNGGLSFRPSLQQVTAQTPYMISLVTYNVYEPTNFTLPGYRLVGLANGTATVNTPSLLFDQYMGAGVYASYAASSSVGYLSSLKTTNFALYNHIEDLVTACNDNFIKTQFTNSNGGNGITAAPLPATLALVTGSSFSNLYQDPTTGKYYVYIPGQDNDPTYIYDFNAGIADAVLGSNGTWSYIAQSGNARRGVYYLVPASAITLPAPTTPPSPPTSLTLNASAIVPMAEITGYGWQAMAIKFGISIDDKTGNEMLSMPVFNPPLPMTVLDVALAAGQSSPAYNSLTPSAPYGYMQCVLQPDKTTTLASVNDSFVDYYYLNTAAQMYLARRTFSTSYPVVTNSTLDFTTGVTAYTTSTYTPPALDYYVDLVTGERYHTNGHPYLTDVTVAYYVPLVTSTNATTQTTTSSLPAYPVQNSGLDYSNPLFLWGGLDMFGENTQLSMMYQNTDPDSGDNNIGYNVYNLQQYSTTFTTLLPGATKGTGAATIYGYAQPVINADGSVTPAPADGNGKPYITATVDVTTTTTTTEISMSTVLLKALNGGSFLLTKSYTMNLNGGLGGGGSSMVTVTESDIAPKQYQISYTDSDGNQVTNTFQMTVPLSSSGAGVPGGAPNYFNNPPLDAALQLQLLQGVPFCAQVVGSRLYGTTTQPVSGSSLGNNATICGILTQPPTGSYISNSGLLGATFNSVSASNNQFFAFYGSYNNAPLSANPPAQLPNPVSPTDIAPAQVASSSNLHPQMGQYFPYSSVVSSLYKSDWILNGAYDGLYAGNFTQEMSGSASTYVKTGAPYLCITPITGSAAVGQSISILQNQYSVINEYAAPTSSSTEYIYRYSYSTASNTVLNQLTEKVGISSNAQGFMSLVSALPISSDRRKVKVEFAESSISGSTATLISNPQAQAVIEANVSYGRPYKVITGAAQARYLYTFSCSGTDAVSQALCTQIAPEGVMYVDIANGIVFETRQDATGAQFAYPAGYSLSGSLLNIISKAIGNAVPKKDAAGTLVIQTPELPAATSATS